MKRKHIILALVLGLLVCIAVQLPADNAFSLGLRSKDLPTNLILRWDLGVALRHTIAPITLAYTAMAELLEWPLQMGIYNNPLYQYTAPFLFSFAWVALITRLRERRPIAPLKRALALAPCLAMIFYALCMTTSSICYYFCLPYRQSFNLGALRLIISAAYAFWLVYFLRLVARHVISQTRRIPTLAPAFGTVFLTLLLVYGWIDYEYWWLPPADGVCLLLGGRLIPPLEDLSPALIAAILTAYCAAYGVLLTLAAMLWNRFFARTTNATPQDV